MTLCKLCNKYECDVKSHVFPKWLYKTLGKNRQLMVQGGDNARIEYMQAGQHDSQLVCDACERLFNTPDTYAASFFRDRDWSQESFSHLPGNSPNSLGFKLKRVPDADYEKLNLFILNLLWRMNNSSLPFFSRVNLGKRSSRLTELVQNQTNCDPTEFTTTMFKLFDTEHDAPPANQFILPPITTRTPDGFWYCCFVMAGFEITVLTSARSHGDVGEGLTLDRKHFLVPGYPFTNSRVVRPIEDAFKSHLSNLTPTQRNQILSQLQK